MGGGSTKAIQVEMSLLKKVNKQCERCVFWSDIATTFYIWFGKQSYQEDHAEVTPPFYTLYSNFGGPSSDRFTEGKVGGGEGLKRLDNFIQF